MHLSAEDNSFKEFRLTEDSLLFQCKDCYLAAVIIFAEKQSHRLLYVLSFICDNWGNLPYRLTTSTEEFAGYNGPKINYSAAAVSPDEIQIVPSGFLEETTYRFFTPDVSVINEISVLFPSAGAAANAYPFDVFSAVFYMLSRYEEYQSKSKDKWGRFPAKESLAYKYSFLHKPVVDIWVTELLQAISKQHSSFTFHRKTKVRFTYDIDVAFAYKGRHIVRQGGSAFKDVIRIDPYNLAQRTAVLAGYLEDPFDTYDYILAESIEPLFFFLLSDAKTKYDRNIHPKHRIMKKLAIKLNRRGLVGIHPSFYSSEKPKKITTEKRALEALTGSRVTRSRQHYLRYTIPHIYRHLQHNHITEDYSMAFAEMPGFRAGTCTPFFFFDVEKNETGSVNIFPSPVMESTFRDDMIMPVQEALSFYKHYFDEVHAMGGSFIPIWHNDTLAANNKQHFRWLHNQVLQYIRRKMEEL